MNLSQFRKATSLKSVSLAFGVLTLTSLAHAGDVRLQYAQEDLATAQGVAETHAKIVRTAKENCPSYSQTRALNEMHACIDTVTDSMVNKIGNASLSAYHADGAKGVTRVQVATKATGNTRNPS